jgi:hypothetical protein
MASAAPIMIAKRFLFVRCFILFSKLCGLRKPVGAVSGDGAQNAAPMLQIYEDDMTGPLHELKQAKPEEQK